MSNGDCCRSDDDFFDQQANDPLPFFNIHGFGPAAQAGLKWGRTLHQLKITLLVSHGHLDSLQLRVNGPVLLTEWLDPFSELIESHQAFLISSQQPFHTFVQPRLLADQMLLTLLRRIPPVWLLPNAA